MDILHAILLGIVEGLTEFLPISSTGHLTIAEKLLGYQVSGADVTAFTAVIQVGAIVAAVVYFWKDIVKIATAWTRGIFDASKRTAEYKMGWYVIFGTMPAVLTGLALKDVIETTFRGLWVVVFGLIVWSFVMLMADKFGKGTRVEKEITWKDALFVGAMQCFSVIPGVSRSGATISAGLFRQLDRVVATRLSFFLGIPVLVAAGGFEAVTRAKDIAGGVGWSATAVATVVSFVVGYVAIAWLIKFVSHNNFTWFIRYRVALAVVIALLVSFGFIGAV